MPFNAEGMKTVLILDADPDFTAWLTVGFQERGYEAVTASSMDVTDALPGEPKAEADLLILNPAMAGAGQFLEKFRQTNNYARVVALLGDAPPPSGTVAGVDLYCRKPEERDEFIRLQWIERVEQMVPVSLGFPWRSRTRPAANLGQYSLSTGSRPHLQSGALEHAEAETEMIMDWKPREGQLIDGKFVLQRHLGGNRQSAVFLTQYGGRERRAAAIKLVATDSANHQRLLSGWERAAELSHPGLIQLFGMGRCELGKVGLLYLVMEYAEENLAEILRERPLTEMEGRETLECVLETLSYLHRKGYVHGRLKPANILAAEDRVKVSSEWIRHAGRVSRSLEAPGIYDPPESPGGAVSPAGDLWCLGMTLVEAATQRLPIHEAGRNRKIVMPERLPPLFDAIARHCLEADPQQRESVAELQARLRPAPVKPEEKTAGPWTAFAKWAYVVPAVTILALSGVLTGPRLLHRQSTPVPDDPKGVASTAVHEPAPAAMSPVLPEGKPSATAQQTPAAQTPVSQPVPDVPLAARETIRGTVRISVRTRVDSSGRVVSASVDSPGRSRYFAGLALKTAQKWKFEPQRSERPLKDWILQFDFTKAGTKVSAERANR